MQDILIAAQALGSLFWTIFWVGAAAYVASKILPAAGEAGDVAKDYIALERAKIRLLASAAGFDLDAMRVKTEKKEPKTFKEQLEEMEELATKQKKKKD